MDLLSVKHTDIRLFVHHCLIIAWITKWLNNSVIIHLVIKLRKYIVIKGSLIGWWSNSNRSFDYGHPFSIHSVFCAVYSDIQNPYQIVQMMKHFFPLLPICQINSFKIDYQTLESFLRSFSNQLIHEEEFFCAKNIFLYQINFCTKIRIYHINNQILKM